MATVGPTLQRLALDLLSLRISFVFVMLRATGLGNKYTVKTISQWKGKSLVFVCRNDSMNCFIEERWLYLHNCSGEFIFITAPSTSAMFIITTLNSILPRVSWKMDIVSSSVNVRSVWPLVENLNNRFSLRFQNCIANVFKQWGSQTEVHPVSTNWSTFPYICSRQWNRWEN